jgi:cytochrome c biogenesis protein ResB
MNCLALCGSFVLDWGGILMLGVLVSLVWRQEREWMVEYLAGEVTDEVFQTVTSWKSWRSARWGALMRGDIAAWRELRRLRQAATELAFNKRKLAQRGQAPVIQKDIDRYRLQLAELGAARGLDVNEG